VLKNETAFPLCRATDSLWNRKVVSLLSAVMTVVRLPISCISSMACWLYDPAVSMATGKDESLYKSLIFCDLVVCCLLGYRSLLVCSGAQNDWTRRKYRELLLIGGYVNTTVILLTRSLSLVRHKSPHRLAWLRATKFSRNCTSWETESTTDFNFMIPLHKFTEQNPRSVSVATSATSMHLFKIYP